MYIELKKIYTCSLTVGTVKIQKTRLYKMDTRLGTFIMHRFDNKLKDFLHLWEDIWFTASYFRKSALTHDERLKAIVISTALSNKELTDTSFLTLHDVAFGNIFRSAKT